MPFYPQLYSRIRELLQTSGGALSAAPSHVEQSWLLRFRQPLIWQHFGAEGPEVRHVLAHDTSCSSTWRITLASPTSLQHVLTPPSMTPAGAAAHLPPGHAYLLLALASREAAGPEPVCPSAAGDCQVRLCRICSHHAPRQPSHGCGIPAAARPGPTARPAPCAIAPGSGGSRGGPHQHIRWGEVRAAVHSAGCKADISDAKQTSLMQNPYHTSRCSTHTVIRTTMPAVRHKM